jgi:hypothetical protein
MRVASASFVLLVFLILPWSLEAAKQPPSLQESAAEPIKYVGTEQTDKRYYDGGLRHVVGVHLYQALRANRTAPPEGGLIGWTYNHQPYLAYWNGRFYLQYLSNLKEEHGPPGRTLLMTSKNGREWSPPHVVFPEYPLPEFDRGSVHVPAGTVAVMHQRMGFYVAPDGRLLTLAFYGYCPTPRQAPNNGKGLGRVVREIKNDGTFGPIYFIRYNRHAGWNETNTSYAFYTHSDDKGFVEACDALLQDKLMTLQWWEEDRATDGFFTINTSEFEPKALSFCHRPDGVVLAVWKAQLAALSADEGKTWTKLVKCPTIMECNAKTWVQRTPDDRYALVYDHSATRRNRFPLAVMTSDDCNQFNDMLCLHGEVSPARFQGIHKNLGPQYVRGIEERNGQPPGKYLWNTYSMNKEDLWVSRARVPITGTVEQQVNDNINQATTEADLDLWNLYMPQWAPISIVPDPMDDKNKCLELRDEEPYDYAQAERVFPENGKVTLGFRVFVRQVGAGLLNVEVNDRHGRRPLRLRFDADWLSLDLAKVAAPPIAIQPGKWLDLALKLDCEAQRYDLAFNGQWIRKEIPFAEKVDTVERLVFRTGQYRGEVSPGMLNGAPDTTGMDLEDLPGADQKVSLSLYLVDDVKTSR